MNKCFLIGKVVSEPIFDFFYLRSNISICHFFLELNEETIIKIYGVDEIADFIYQRIHINEYVSIEGIVCSNDDDFSAKITDIEPLKKWNNP